MPQGDVVTFHEQGSWKNRVEGEGGSEQSYSSRDEAIVAGRALAMQREVEHIIRREDGTIGERNSYGHDPRHVEG
jgi:Uncharacterized protein conserved in bacteria (DUF2188)